MLSHLARPAPHPYPCPPCPSSLFHSCCHLIDPFPFTARSPWLTCPLHQFLWPKRPSAKCNVTCRCLTEYLSDLPLPGGDATRYHSLRPSSRHRFPLFLTTPHSLFPSEVCQLETYHSTAGRQAKSQLTQLSCTATSLFFVPGRSHAAQPLFFSLTDAWRLFTNINSTSVPRRLVAIRHPSLRELAIARL